MVLRNPIKTYEQSTQFKPAILIFYLYYHNQDQREPHLVSIIQELAKHNIKTDIIVMDFAKAFDKVPRLDSPNLIITALNITP